MARKQVEWTTRLHRIKELTPCADCGINYHPAQMTFDHLGEKTASINSMTSYSEERKVAELAKCEVVCANCHALRTWNRRQQGAPRQYRKGDLDPMLPAL